ncbi:hypothetical protein Tco_1392832 [Tanacetum coccineum]
MEAFGIANMAMGFYGVGELAGKVLEGVLWVCMDSPKGLTAIWCKRELCHEFYATFEFDEVVAVNELMMKKAIKFRLCGKAYAMSILDFAKRLGLYTCTEIQEYGFETYFIGGLRNDDDFSVDQYWLWQVDEEKGSWNTKRKVSVMGWFLVAAGLVGASVLQFVTRIEKRLGILSDVVLNGLSALTYCRTLDANILRELIGSNGRLIPEEIALSIPRVVTPKTQRPTTSDLYNKISQLETRIGEIERMTRMQSDHSDKYASALEHIASHFGVTLRDPYNPPILVFVFCVCRTHDDEAVSSSSRPKRARITKNVEEALMGRVLHEFLLWGNCNMTLKNKYNTNIAGNLSKQIYSPFIVDWNVLNLLGCDNAIEDMLEVRVNEMGSNEVLFTSEAWKRAFDINEPIYTELCHEFYATFEFDEVVADDKSMTKKEINIRVCVKAYSMSVLDFGKCLDLYTGAEIQEYGFETYFIGGLRNDDDFSPNQYWLNISSEEKLTLSRSSAKTIRKPMLRVLHKMITYGLCKRTTGYDKWMKKKGVGTHRESLTWCGQFVMRIAKRLSILSNEVLNGLSAPTYCRTLDANILRELIGSNGRLIPKEIAPSIPRVVTPRAERPTTSDLYDKKSQLETRIGEIERMMRRQSYHSDIYARVLEHIASHFGLTLRDPYDPPSYFE